MAWSLAYSIDSTLKKQAVMTVAPFIVVSVLYIGCVYLRDKK
ncbi:MAG: QVPTGV class sortase B protein-sorting domain-containing protein [Methyloprofundus sp.]|nr:QVPTGV class sortase B protein-sorting domain-containing protein [Methyloprofundus sp.]